MAANASVETSEVRVPARGAPDGLPGFLAVPEDAIGCVIFAHGSGSSRFSARNRAVAAALNEAGFATLLFDLLTEEEAHDRANVFDIPNLSDRVVAALDWAVERPELESLPIGLFGSSTGAAAALAAATERPDTVRAVVSRGGRPDLLDGQLAYVAAPTLLVVGEADIDVLAMTESILDQLRCENRLSVVPGATHLFPEAGAMEEVVKLARDWFRAALVGAET